MHPTPSPAPPSSPALATASPLGFASDNYAPAHPDVLHAVCAANAGYARAYGQDAWTATADACFERHFGPQARAFYVFNGTAANVLALQSMVRSYEAVLCSDAAHILVHECGAPSHFTGATLLPIPTSDGKLRPQQLQAYVSALGNPHQVQPKVVSLTQPTEWGTLYTREEIAGLVDVAHGYGWYVHMDGARLALAATALGCTLREITTDLGVDVVAFGGTKLGMLLGEAVVFLNPQLAQQAHQSCPFWRKQAMQLASKMRFISAQFVALLEGDLWQRNACHALDMTKLLEKHLREALHLHPVMPVAANTVFIRLPKTVYEALQAEMPCYAWCKPVTHQGDEGFSGSETEVITRLMTSYATQPEEITWLVETLRRLLVSPANA